MSFTADGEHAFAPAPDPATHDGESSAFNENVNPEAGNVDKIREILFGGQMRAYDKRFSRLEDRLAKKGYHTPYSASIICGNFLGKEKRKTIASSTGEV